MAAYNQDFLQDAFFHVDNLKLTLTRLKITYNRDRTIVCCIDKLLYDCELIQLIIQTYDIYNFRYLCNKINNSFINPNSHGVHVVITKKRYGPTIDYGKLEFIKLAV